MRTGSATKVKMKEIKMDRECLKKYAGMIKKKREWVNTTLPPLQKKEKKDEENYYIEGVDCKN